MAEDFHEMDEKEIKIVMYRFISEIHGEDLRKVLNYFAEKKGYAQEYIYIGFCEDGEDEEDEEDNDPFLRLDDKHVLLEQDMAISFGGKTEFAYLDFPTFYRYLSHQINRRVKMDSKNNDLIGLLAKVKKGLDV